MKPPLAALPYSQHTPDIIAALRLYAGESLFYSDTLMHDYLLRHRLIRRDRDYQAIRWTLTPEGRRVLAEQETT